MPKVVVSSRQSSALYGEELYEIISRPPSWITRWGITLVTLFFLLIVAACWMISYPDIVSVPVTITSTDPPRKLVMRSEGKLEKILVNDGEQVKAGQMLGFCESATNPYDIIELETYLKKISVLVQKEQWHSIFQIKLNRSGNFGELQDDFQLFSQKSEELKAYLNEGFYVKKLLLLSEDMKDLQDLEQNISQQQELQSSDLEIAQREFIVHEKLFQKKVISNLEYEREKAKLLGRKIPVKNIESSLIQNRLEQVAKKKEVLELENLIREQRVGFLQVLQTLQSNLKVWKQRYLLVAPVSGTIAFSAPWSEQQHIPLGQELFKIEPQSGELKGIVKIGQINSGKLLIGQQVRIKLDGYPYTEFGIVDGFLTNVSPTPGADSLYWGYISLPNQLKTRYGKVLSYRNDLKGRAEIITKDRNVITRLLASSNLMN